MTTTLFRICTVDGCARTVDSRDMCPRHYRQWLRHGHVIPVKKALPLQEVIRLRRAVGVPDTGPTPEQLRQWARVEALEDGQVSA